MFTSVIPPRLAVSLSWQCQRSGAIRNQSGAISESHEIIQYFHEGYFEISKWIQQIRYRNKNTQNIFFSRFLLLLLDQIS
jgi:hypothetical protein